MFLSECGVETLAMEGSDPLTESKAKPGEEGGLQKSIEKRELLVNSLGDCGRLPI